MIESDMIRHLKAMTGETDEDVLLTYIKIAESKILNRLYPYGVPPDFIEIPEQYNFTLLEIACFLLNRRGAEGETSHGENGISRSYENGDVPESLMRTIVPYATSVLGDCR